MPRLNDIVQNVYRTDLIGRVTADRPLEVDGQLTDPTAWRTVGPAMPDNPSWRADYGAYLRDMASAYPW